LGLLTFVVPAFFCSTARATGIDADDGGGTGLVGLDDVEFVVCVLTNDLGGVALAEGYDS